MDMFDFDGEPTDIELRTIEAEWPLIVAEMAVVDAEIAAARMGDGMTELGRRRIRRAETRLSQVIAARANPTQPLDGVA
jgi:hypothetical protein